MVKRPRKKAVGDTVVDLVGNTVVDLIDATSEEPVLRKLTEAFPAVATHMTSGDKTTIDALLQAVPYPFGGGRAGFVHALAELAESGQPYNLQDGTFKKAATQLSLALTPSKPIKELWRDCEDAAAKVLAAREAKLEFAALMAKYAHNLIPAEYKLNVEGKTIDFLIKSNAEMRLALEAALLETGKKAEGKLRVGIFLKLFNATEPLVIDGNLTPLVADTLHLFKIPSSEMIEIMPTLKNKLLYTDMVRKDLPFLAMAMRKHRIFTLAAMCAACPSAATKQIKNEIIAKLHSTSPDLLREDPEQSDAVRVLVKTFGTPYRDILSLEELAPASLMTDATPRVLTAGTDLS